MCTKYEIGTKVRIRTDLNTNELYNGIDFSVDMKPYMGKEATIVDYNDSAYFLDIDNGFWSWGEKMLVKISDTPTFQEIFDRVDKSITSDELFRNGEIIEDSEGYEAYYSDAPGGTYNRVRIVKLDEKYFVYKEKIVINSDSSKKSECTAFYELK